MKTQKAKELETEITDLIQAAAVLTKDHLRLKKRAAKQGLKSVPADKRISDLLERAIEKEFELDALRNGGKTIE